MKPKLECILNAITLAFSSKKGFIGVRSDPNDQNRLLVFVANFDCELAQTLKEIGLVFGEFKLELVTLNEL